MADVPHRGNAPAAAPGRFNRLPVGMPASVAVCIGFLAIVSFVAAFAQVLTPFPYEATDLLYRLRPPFWMDRAIDAHPLGTDKLGRDLLSRLLIATQVSMALALLGTLIGAVMGTALGVLAAHRGGWVDELVMMAVDWQAAMPFLIIALAVLAFFGNAFLLFLALMALYGWETYARLTRGLVLSAREQGYAIAVRSLGARPGRLYLKHILPNVVGPLIVQLTLNFPQTILLETSLSFLGLGIQPPLTSLGQMLGEGRDYLLTAWWLAVIPGAVIFLTTLSMSMVGDWLRSHLDPTQR